MTVCEFSCFMSGQLLQNERVSIFNTDYWRLFPAFAVALAMASEGCTSVQLVADYNKKIDDGVTELQKKTDTLLVKLERQPEPYSKHTPFYDDAKVQLSLLKTRADAIALNSLTSSQIDLLKSSFTEMEANDKKGNLDRDTIPGVQDALDRQFTSILKLEEAKKRAEKAPATTKSS
jgi:hypothetical protein